MGLAAAPGGRSRLLGGAAGGMAEFGAFEVFFATCCVWQEWVLAARVALHLLASWGGCEEGAARLPPAGVGKLGRKQNSPSPGLASATVGWSLAVGNSVFGQRIGARRQGWDVGEALVEALGSVVPSWRHLLEPSQPPGGCGDWQAGG